METYGLWIEQAGVENFKNKKRRKTMFNQKKVALLSGSLFLAGLVCGCGSTKRIESTEVPNKPMANEEAPVQKANLASSGYYIVENRDCLWTIAAKPRVYGDSFEWPALFKANRDQIKDPDLIYPRQDLRVDEGLSLEEMNNAKRMAMATPKYVPHSKPRETLPVDYF
jgi:hypothetical protein